MKLALVQMTSQKADTDANIHRACRFIDSADYLGADVICFPEANLTGFVTPRKFPNAVIGWEHPALETLYERSDSSPASIVVGIVEHNPSGGRPFVSQAVIRRGRIVARYRKLHIAGDEELLFEQGSDVSICEHDGKKFGLLVCADQQRKDLFARCKDRGAGLVILPSAPGLFGAQSRRDWQSGYEWWRETCRDGIGAYARELGIWTAATAQAGRTQDEDFPGGGWVYAPSGQLTAATKDWEEGMIVADVTL